MKPPKEIFFAVNSRGKFITIADEVTEREAKAMAFVAGDSVVRYVLAPKRRKAKKVRK